MGSKNNSWMSFSDLMTGLMVIFMFVAISYILEVQKAEQQRQKVVTDFQDSKSAIYKDLRSAFDEEKKEWEMEIGKDLSIRFTNPQVIFALGKSDVTPTFQKILNDFLPRYFNILLKEEYRTRIKEIRIEGHTDTLAIYSKQVTLISRMFYCHKRDLLKFLNILDRWNIIRTYLKNKKSNYNTGLQLMDYPMGVLLMIISKKVFYRMNQ